MSRDARPGAPGFAVLFLLMGIAALVGGLVVEASRSRPSLAARLPDPKTDAAPKGKRLNTPVFHARRDPQALARPIARRRMDARITSSLSGATEKRCIGVFDGDSELHGEGLNTPLPGASTQKLLVAAAALRVFGPDHQFGTEAVVTEDPSDGVVVGDLYLVGRGDPLLDTNSYRSTFKNPEPSTSMESIADALVATGLRSISGSIVGDEARYDTLRVVESWPQRLIDQNQVGPLSALSVNDARTYNPLVADGKALPAQAPATYAASTLTALLAQRGVVINGAPREGAVPAGTPVWKSFPSLPVREIVGEMLKFSDNNTAELLTKELGKQVRSEGTTAAGIAVIVDTLTAEGYPMEGVTIHDGSGLDGTARVTCQLLLEILRRDGPSGVITTGLAVAGKTGTLEERFVNTAAEGRVQAKTGTLNSVTGLTGWATSTAGVPLRFAVLLVREPRIGAADSDAMKRLVLALLTYPESVQTKELQPKLVS